VAQGCFDSAESSFDDPAELNMTGIVSESSRAIMSESFRDACIDAWG
jgi:hypothetical protein